MTRPVENWQDDGDSGERFSAEPRTQVERRAQQVWALLPGATMTRTRDVVQLDYAGERGIVAVVTAEALELRLPTVEWTHGAYGPAAASRLWQRVLWEELPATALAERIAQAIAARQAEFKRCRYCGQLVPPERRVDDDVCHGCASRYEGVVF